MYERIRSYLSHQFELRRLRGANNRIARKVYVTNFHKLTLGEYVFIGPECFLDTRGSITISDGAIISSFVRILSSIHDMGDGSVLPYGLEDLQKPVSLGRGCWIGLGAIIMPGVELGDACVVGAGAVVTKSFPAGSVVGGNPATLIRQRQFDQSAISQSNYLNRIKY